MGQNETLAAIHGQLQQAAEAGRAQNQTLAWQRITMKRMLEGIDLAMVSLPPEARVILAGALAGADRDARVVLGP
jgi:hypothetical protein